YNFVTELTSMVVIQNNITRAVEENAETGNDEADTQQYFRHSAYSGVFAARGNNHMSSGYMMHCTSTDNNTYVDMCGGVCEETCATVRPACSSPCPVRRPYCACRTGLVRDERTKLCVPVERCSVTTEHQRVPHNTTVMVNDSGESGERAAADGW
ncbi:unnamed protein product, partial [Sphagnum balticum]